MTDDWRRGTAPFVSTAGVPLRFRDGGRRDNRSSVPGLQSSYSVNKRFLHPVENDDADK